MATSRSLTSTGTVQVNHSQFTIGSAEVDTLDTRTRGSLLEVGPGFATTFTGITYGPARVTLRLLDQPPAAPGGEWEAVEDTTITSSEAIGVFTLDGEPADGITAFPAGTYGLRASVRGRDIATSTEVTEPPEDYLIELWPSLNTGDTLVVTTLRKTDRAWPIGDKTEHEPDPVPQPDYSKIWVRDRHGVPVAVDLDSDLGLAALEDRRSFGGAPLTDKHRENDSAQPWLHLDRPLIDWLIEQTADVHEQFAAACVRLSSARADLDTVPWISDFIDATLAAEIAPTDPFDIAERVLQDRRARPNDQRRPGVDPVRFGRPGESTRLRRRRCKEAARKWHPRTDPWPSRCSTGRCAQRDHWCPRR
ncbi:hypothetical protein [Rhodococcus sp. As11]|uniref:hypothetical protein n=1 Tax=Rhodococcus sp. As11 TaxID=3029189 RepID=UPI003B79A806